MARHNRTKYVDYTLIRVTAVLHLIFGSIILILSGIVLFALPAYAFYLTFLIGFYFFLPGVIISFQLVHRKTARSWSRLMVPVWRWLG